MNGETYVLETGLTADLALVKAWKGDTEGNLVYRKTARNFNPMMATARQGHGGGSGGAGRAGHARSGPDPHAGHLRAPDLQGRSYEKRIEQRTVRKRGSRVMPWTREDLARARRANCATAST